jgi:hypothetical protein
MLSTRLAPPPVLPEFASDGWVVWGGTGPTGASGMSAMSEGRAPRSSSTGDFPGSSTSAPAVPLGSGGNTGLSVGLLSTVGGSRTAGVLPADVPEGSVAPGAD